MYDLIIIGGGPAGISASVYAARKKLNTLIIASEIGGQSVVSAGIENWIGTPTISGFNLAKNFEKHIRLYENKCLDIKKETVTEIKDENNFITVKTNNGLYKTKTLMYCAGSSRRKIQAQGAEEFEHKGITYCATCDGPVFAVIKLFSSFISVTVSFFISRHLFSYNLICFSKFFARLNPDIVGVPIQFSMPAETTLCPPISDAIISVLSFFLAAYTEAEIPAGPPPMIIKSYI